MLDRKLGVLYLRNKLSKKNNLKKIDLEGDKIEQVCNVLFLNV